MPKTRYLICIAILLAAAGLAACTGQSREAATVMTPSAGFTETASPPATDTPDQNLPTIAVSPTSGPQPAVPSTPAEAGPALQFSDAPDRDLFRLTEELVPGSGSISRTPSGSGVPLEAGRTDTFWLVDLANPRAYQSDFELVLVTPRAYWYVEYGLDIDRERLERSAALFEENTYPAVTQVFGSEWSPGIDNDPHLNILNASIRGVAGYFSSTDEYPAAVRPRSNEREMIYVNAVSVPPGAANYDQVLAHELQHAIHWNADNSEDTWVNEGLAELSSSIAFDSRFSVGQYLSDPTTSLVHWPLSSVGSIGNYGAASLFMHFLTEHYGGRDSLKRLLAQPEDGIAGINGYLAALGYDARFDDVFREWAAANIIDGAGILGYADMSAGADISRKIDGSGQFESRLSQYGVEYTELKLVPEGSSLSFQGPATTPLLPIDVGAGCWWSNSGDSIDSTLARRVSLPAGEEAALRYEVWFEIEKDWDYAYVEVSVDGGHTWRIFETSATSQENPIGSGFGPGYTGHSGGWVEESIDLTAYAGRDILVRLQYITDDAINGSGACFRGLTIEAAGITGEDTGWNASGFEFTDNVVRQNFQVQVITIGDAPVVRQMPLNADNFGVLALPTLKDGERLVVAVGLLAEKTREQAGYTLEVSPAK
ncbi:MAG: immune inhibitor A [Chloroflexi bacterium]|nr:immune inhibitor A [Chloroflexota bacterium]MDA1271591.1 immune inhibitor A [Chloroflexota bacterium]PKB58361.1 MAG: hypothetical protein BZY83_07615 [SAR202 cluster bacterium Casp-Chloro-G2]